MGKNRDSKMGKCTKRLMKLVIIRHCVFMMVKLVVWFGWFWMSDMKMKWRSKVGNERQEMDGLNVIIWVKWESINIDWIASQEMDEWSDCLCKHG